MTGRSQEELVAMLRSTRQGESVSVVVARQEDIFLPRELVRECEHTHTKNLQHPCPHTALLNLHTVSHLSSSLVCQSFPPLLFIICVFCVAVFAHFLSPPLHPALLFFHTFPPHCVSFSFFTPRGANLFTSMPLCL